MRGAEAAEVFVRAAADKTTVAIGEPMTYRVTIERPAALAVTWPEIGAELGGFSVEQMRSSPGLRRGETVTEERAYRLISFSTGEHTIPEPVVSYQALGGSRGEARGPPLTVTVKSALPKEWASQDIRDVKPLLALHAWLWWLLGAAVLAGAGVGVWWVKARAGTPALGPAPRPPHEIALEALERLRQEWLPSKGRYEEYYVRLSGIARTYVEGRFALRAPEMTTEEFLQSVVQAPELSTEQRELLREFLTHCDLVKFARYQPSPEEAGRMFASAQRFVNETKPAADEVC